MIAGPSAAADPSRYMTAELITESGFPAPGSTILVGIRFDPRPGWHGYWSNPGDSGIAPSVRWTAPQGVTFGPLLHPAPSLLTANGVSSYVHDGPHVLLSRMSVPAAFAQGSPIPVVAELHWAACTADQCVPLHAELKLDLKAGDGAKGKGWPALRTAAARLPVAVPSGHFTRDKSLVRLVLPASVHLDPGSTHFFADEGDTFDSAKGHTELRDGMLTITGPAMAKLPRSIAGVATDGLNSYRIAFDRREKPFEPAKMPVSAAAAATAPSSNPADPLASSAPQSDTKSAGAAPNRKQMWIAILAAVFAVAGLFLTGRLAKRP